MDDAHVLGVMHRGEVTHADGLRIDLMVQGFPEFVGPRGLKPAARLFGAFQFQDSVSQLATDSIDRLRIRVGVEHVL